MGDRPDDPGGTKLFVPPVPPLTPMDILISAAESSMETDGSVTDVSNKNRKRQFSRAICRTCNKKKSRQGSKKENPNGCVCDTIPKDTNNDGRNVNLLQEQIFIAPSVAKTMNVKQQESSQVPQPQESARVPVGRTSYQASDAAPYVVHVQKNYSGNDNTTLHPITFGRWLKKNFVNGIVNGSLKRIGRNRISIAFQNYSDANAFIVNKNFSDEGYKMFIPTFNVTRMGVIRGVPTDWSDEEVLATITVPIGCGPIIKIRRLRRKVVVDGNSTFENTGTVVVTFDGQILPSRVYMCYTALSVSLYIYPTVQCFNCCRYGHVKSQCRSTPRCYKCGQGHSGDSCKLDEDDYWCCLCKGNHEATNRKCLEFSRQKSIKETMSKSCISYMEAVKLHPAIDKLSYADALLKTTSTTSSTITAHSNPPQSKIDPVQHSYKKSVVLKPKPPTKLSKGYDIGAHNEIVKTPILPKSLPVYNNIENNDVNKMKIPDIIQALIQLLSQSKTLSPSNVALVIDELNQISNNNGSKSQSNSVELPKHQ